MYFAAEKAGGDAGGRLHEPRTVVTWYHCYLAHLHRPPTKARCLTLSRSRWHIEQYFQRTKDDPGLDHFPEPNRDTALTKS